MKLVIWGAGAIGGTIGAYLVRAGHEVIFVDQDVDHVAAINKSGVRIFGPIDEFTIPATAFTPDTIEGAYETIVLSTKAHHTKGATGMLKPHLHPDGCVVSAQNGLNERVIAEIIGSQRTIGSFVNFGADYMEPGVIHFGGRGAVVLGEIDSKITDRIQSLHQVFLDFDDKAIVTDNIWGFLWGKQAYGAMLYITALTDEAIADALADIRYRDLYITIAHEILGVTQALGIKPESFNGFDSSAFMPGVAADTSARSMDDMVAFNRKSAKTHSGIWRDLAVRKRATEVNAYDEVISEGKRLGIPTPVTARMIEMIHEIEAGKRPQALSNLDELKASLG